MVYVPASDGRWVSEDYARLAEVIQDYDPYLELRWIPPDKRSRDDKKPYMIVDTKINHPVFFVSELDTPVDILARLFESDNHIGSVLDRLELHNKAQEIMKMKRRAEEMAETLDAASFLFQSPLNSLTMNGKRYDENRRVVGPAKGRTIL